MRVIRAQTEGPRMRIMPFVKVPALMMRDLGRPMAKGLHF